MVEVISDTWIQLGLVLTSSPTEGGKKANAGDQSTSVPCRNGSTIVLVDIGNGVSRERSLWSW